MKFFNDGWPSTVKTKALLDFVACQHQLSMYDGCILKCAEEPRIVVPKTIREPLLSELHKAHVGMERMKKLARRFIWWPGIDRDIESMAQNCENCAVHADRPPEVPLHPWELPECPWARIHIDFARPFCKKMWFVVVDAFSKWPEVIQLPEGATSASQTITQLRRIFARFGIPKQIVSDNGPHFVSSEFRTFCKKQGIRHTLVPPYHPQSNGQVERFVKTLKGAIKKGMESGKASLEEVVTDFLSVYRNTSHSTTNVSPARLLMNRDLRCQLDLLKPPQKSSVLTKTLKETVKKAQAKQERGHDQTASERNAIRPYDMVSVRHTKMPKWRNARVVQVLGERYYTVQYTDTGVRQKVHVDHLRLHPRSNQLPTQQLVQGEPDLEPGDVAGSSNRDNKREDQFSSDT